MLDSLPRFESPSQYVSIKASLSDARPADAVDWSLATPDIRAWRLHKDEAALRRIVDEHKPKIAGMARRMAAGQGHSDDLVSVGLIAMLKALDRYTPMADIPFFAYAARFVRSAMSRETSFVLSVVKVPESLTRAGPDGQVDADEAALAHEARYVSDIDDVHEVTAHSDAVTAETDMLADESCADLRASLVRAAGVLSPLERQLVLWRVDGRENPAGKAAELDISEEKMRKTENRALLRMRSHLLRQGVTPGSLNADE